MELPVKITPKALEEIRAIIDHKKIPEDYHLRIGVKGSGCVGTEFLIGFDKKEKTDLEYKLEDMNILIARKDLMYLLDVKLDFYEGADARGFTFDK